MNDNSVTFTDDEGVETTFYIIEQTVLSGTTYLLVTDSNGDEDEVTSLILKEIASEGKDDMVAFGVVNDEVELESVAKIFSELLSDSDIDLEV